MENIKENISGIDFFLKQSIDKRVLMRLFYRKKSLFEIDTLKFAQTWFTKYDTENLNISREEDYVIYCTSYEKFYHYSLLQDITQGEFKFFPFKDRLDGNRITAYAYYFDSPNSPESFLNFLNLLISTKYKSIDLSKVNFHLCELDPV